MTGNDILPGKVQREYLLLCSRITFPQVPDWANLFVNRRDPAGAAVWFVASTLSRFEHEDIDLDVGDQRIISGHLDIIAGNRKCTDR